MSKSGDGMTEAEYERLMELKRQQIIQKLYKEDGNEEAAAEREANVRKLEPQVKVDEQNRAARALSQKDPVAGDKLKLVLEKIGEHPTYKFLKEDFAKMQENLKNLNNIMSEKILKGDFSPHAKNDAAKDNEATLKPIEEKIGTQNLVAKLPTDKSDKKAIVDFKIEEVIKLAENLKAKIELNRKLIETIQTIQKTKEAAGEKCHFSDLIEKFFDNAVKVDVNGPEVQFKDVSDYNKLIGEIISFLEAHIV